MSFHFIVNPVAKNGLSLKKWKKLEKYLKTNDIPYHVYLTKNRGDGKQLAESILKDKSQNHFLFAVGGDGTVNEVVNGIHPHRNGIFGCIPAGSGNDFSRGFLIPKKLNKIFPSLLKHKSEFIPYQYIDIGCYKDKHIKGVFVNNLGIGLDAIIAKSVNQSKLKPLFNRLALGKLVYVFYLFKEVLLFKPSTLTISIDGQTRTIEKTWLATISNHPYFGGGMKISPFSNAYDGEFEVTIVHNISKLKILALFITVFWGGHTKMKEVTTLKGKEISIGTDANFPIHADGEFIGYKSIQINVEPQYLPLLTS